MKYLTPQQRYNQAIKKVRITAERERRAHMRGEIPYLPGNYIQREKESVIREIGRAYEAGVEAGKRTSLLYRLMARFRR